MRFTYWWIVNSEANRWFSFSEPFAILNLSGMPSREMPVMTALYVWAEALVFLEKVFWFSVCMLVCVSTYKREHLLIWLPQPFSHCHNHKAEFIRLLGKKKWKSTVWLCPAIFEHPELPRTHHKSGHCVTWLAKKYFLLHWNSLPLHAAQCYKLWHNPDVGCFCIFQKAQTGNMLSGGDGKPDWILWGGRLRQCCDLPLRVAIDVQ